MSLETQVKNKPTNGDTSSTVNDPDKTKRTPNLVRRVRPTAAELQADKYSQIKKKEKPHRILLKIVGRAALVLFSIILLTAAGLYGVCAVVFLGPSPSARDKLVTSTLEMSAAKFVPRLFFSPEEIDTILENNKVVEVEDITDTNLVVIPPQTDNPEEENDEWKDHPDGIKLEKIKGKTYRGYILTIRDPSRVYVATSSDFTSGAPGLRIMEAVTREGAVAAINAGGFPDVGGVGLGNVPIGLTMSKGKLLWGGTQQWYSGVVGFDSENKLIVGNLSGQQALNLGMRDCICFGPILVVNGEPAQVTGDSGSLNPRTAIGQRQDGAVIFLCIDGRMPNSLGAAYSDLIDIMVEYGAYNAMNLDGGSSSHMVYKNEYINISSSLYGPRRMPTYFMVK